MNRTLLATALLAGAALGSSFAASAQTNTATTVQRDVNQEQRIENGLQSGTITTREGAELQRDESQINRLQTRELRDGTLSAADRARLTAAQNRTSRQISSAVHNGVDGNPMSASSQRTQAEVQRNINQQTRIEAGVQNGGLTNHEASRLEHGEARIDHNEYNVGRDGRVSANEQARVTTRDNRESTRIHNQRWDGQRRR